MPEIYKSIFNNEIAAHMLIRKVELGNEAYRHYKNVIRNFDNYLYIINHNEKSITIDIIDNWIKQVSYGISINTVGQYIHYIRQLLNYLISCGYKCAIPKNIISRDTYIPYLYSDEELNKIFAAADNLKAPHAVKNKWIETEMPMLLRLLFCCGLRVGEATNIKIKDIDFKQNLILLKVTKKYKQRIVPYVESLADIIYSYCLAMGILANPEAYLFPGIDKETALASNSIRNYFTEILKVAGIARASYRANERGPCIHCFRHTFAVRSFNQAERIGLRAKESVPFLSTYLGHDSLYETEKYLKFSGDAFPDTLIKFQAFVGDIFPEVTIDE